MNDLQIFSKDVIPVYDTDTGEKVVLGRELHERLKIKDKYTDWMQRMIGYGFGEDSDYYTLRKKPKRQDGTEMPGERIDHIMTLDMAKHIAMIQRTPQGMAIRQKLIEMEKKLTTPEPEPPELALSKALVMAQGIIAREQERSKQLEKENTKLKPAAEYAHNMLLSDETLTVTQIALNFGMTANKLNKLLNEWGIQRKVNKQWIPKRKYIDKGYTLSIPVEVGNGETKENTRWNRTGQAFIYKQMHDHGYLTVKEQQEEKAKERKVLPSPAEQTA
jgi:anti-repressor protein